MDIIIMGMGMIMITDTIMDTGIITTITMNRRIWSEEVLFLKKQVTTAKKKKKSMEKTATTHTITTTKDLDNPENTHIYYPKNVHVKNTLILMCIRLCCMLLVIWCFLLVC